MGTVKSKYWTGLLLMALTFWSCRFGPDDPVPVESVFTVQPESGFTTTRFEFDAGRSFEGSNEDHPVLIRYDWQGDGTWDQDYTSSPKLVRRFLLPGTYEVRMEARNVQGSRDTSSRVIVVQQGFSAPSALMTVTPDSANRFAVFHFDASASFDDEDSSDLLTYRWDFNGDGNWETVFNKAPMVSFIFSEPGKYQAAVEVMDPTRRSTVLRRPVTVNLLNDSIQPRFEIKAGFSTVTTILEFDASGSFFQDRTDKVLTYSWDLLNDGLWEVTDDASPILKRVIRREGMAEIRLRVKDDRGLYMDLVRKLEIFPADARPVPVMVAGNHVGNPKTGYFFSSFGTTDRETSILDLKYQWDTNDDGEWEARYDNSREITCSFTGIGTHVVRLKVTDDHENSATVSDSVTVFPGDHETGLLADKRLFIPDYYGTVRIGKLWWMQENLRIEIEPGPTGKPPELIRWCYGSNGLNCSLYGGLYNYKAVKYPDGGICPKGWRLPTRADFQEMIELESAGSIVPLLIGGSSELHIRTGGYVDFDRKSVGLGTVAQFWLSDINKYRQPYAWYIDKTKGESKAVVTSQTAGYSVRCVKSDQ